MEEPRPTSRETVRVLAALSDENRYRIVELLAAEEREMTCGAIGKALDLSPSLLSHHLGILSEAGLLGRRKNGLWTMNVLERSVIERQVAALQALIGRRTNGRTNGALPARDGNGRGDAADATAPSSLNGPGESGDEAIASS